MHLLITGGAGYIGSQLLALLLEKGHEVTVLDDLSTGCRTALTLAQSIAGRRCTFVHGSTRVPADVRRALVGVDAVLHLAAFKDVAESVRQPARYHANNVGGMTVLLDEMERVGLRRIVFSSSAAVYGDQPTLPLHEGLPLQPSSPYGQTKAIGEQLLSDLVDKSDWAAVSLRYFNPVGAHPSGRLGELSPQAKGLVPAMLRALAGEGPPLTVFGTDHPTPDGTCERDFVHVWDVARAHELALSALATPGHHIFNVGTGTAHSVQATIDTCGRIAGRAVPHTKGPARPGDVVRSLADPRRIAAALGFQAAHGLDDMLRSAWAWHQSRQAPPPPAPPAPSP